MPSPEPVYMAPPPDQQGLLNMTIIKYEGKYSSISMKMSPGYQYFPLPLDVKEKVSQALCVI